MPQWGKILKLASIEKLEVQKGGIRGAWFETRLHWEVISTHHPPVVGCTRLRKLLCRSCVVSKYVSRNFSGKGCVIHIYQQNSLTVAYAA